MRLTCCVPNCTPRLFTRTQHSNQKSATGWILVSCWVLGYRSVSAAWFQFHQSCTVGFSLRLWFDFPSDFYARHNSLSMMHNESGELSGNIFSRGPLSSTFFKTHFTVVLKRSSFSCRDDSLEEATPGPSVFYIYSFTWKIAFTRRQSDVFMSHVLSEHQSKTQTYWIHDDTEHLKQKIIRSDTLQLECLSFFCLINDFNSYQLSIIHDVLFSADQQINYSF